MGDFTPAERLHALLMDLHRFVRDVDCGTAGNTDEIAQRSRSLQARLEVEFAALEAGAVPRCETCEHWDNLVTANRYHGACRLNEHDPFARAAFSSMMTHASFGCVQWEAK